MSQLRFADLFDGRLQKYGVYERVVDKESIATCRSLTDGANSVWIEGSLDGHVTGLLLKGSNNPDLIFRAVHAALGVRIVTEHEPEFWGHQTREQWSQARSLEQHETFYHELRKYLDGQPNEIEADAKANSEREGAPSMTMDLIKAQVAKHYVAEDPTLLQPENKAKLITKMLARFEDMRAVFSEFADIRSSFQMHDSRELEAREDVEDGPLPGAYVFEIDQRSLIVARERPGFREAAAGRQRGAGELDNDIQF